MRLPSDCLKVARDYRGLTFHFKEFKPVFISEFTHIDLMSESNSPEQLENKICALVEKLKVSK